MIQRITIIVFAIVYFEFQSDLPNIGSILIKCSVLTCTRKKRCWIMFFLLPNSVLCDEDIFDKIK